MLTLLHLYASQTRRERFEKPFFHRFGVVTAFTLAEADHLVQQATPHAVVRDVQVADGDAFQISSKLHLQSDEDVCLVHGAPQLRSKRRNCAETVDVEGRSLSIGR